MNQYDGRRCQTLDCMEIVRTFHPIGQGAFYSERFYSIMNKEARYNIVYDCGTSWGTLSKAQKVVRSAFDKNDTIDYLFISHLDYDHISLIVTLMDSVQNIKNIVLPLVSEDELVIAIALNRISGYEDAVVFLEKLRNHYDIKEGSDRKKDDFTVLEVAGEETSPGIKGAQLWKAGESRNLDNEKEWLLIPRNVKTRERRAELERSLDELFKKQHVCNVLSKKEVFNGREFLEKLKDGKFVDSVMRNLVLCKEIKKAYEKVAGGTNENSLLLYSGPASTESRYRIRIECMPRAKRPHYHTFNAGCLYTGDSNCNINEWQRSMYPAFWDSIKTIQLPHHGSLSSFKLTENDIDKAYIMPVSCGISNSYGHPSGKVLAYLMMKDCCTKIVTELADSVYMQRISK